MQQFSIDTYTEATCTHITKRSEQMDSGLVHSKELTWEIEGSNKILNLFGPSILPSLYRHPKSKTLPGVDDPRTELICPLLTNPHPIGFHGTGYMVTIKYGPVSGDLIELTDSEVLKCKVDAKEGGSAKLYFHTLHTGLSMEQMGRIDTFDGKKLSILAAPPALQDGAGKGKKGAEPPKDTKTKPLEFEGKAPEKDATQVFSETHAPAKKVVAKKTPAKKAAAKSPAKKSAKPKADAREWPADIRYGHADKPPVQAEPKVSKAARKRMRIGE